MCCWLRQLKVPSTVLLDAEPSLPSVSRYRVLAIDHDLLSFSDLRFEQWPAVLITNPKDAQYLHPGMEPLGRIRRSTHIRLLRESFKRQNLMI